MNDLEMRTANRIRSHLAREVLCREDEFPYDDEASFLEQGIVDSIGFMELVAFVEREFHIRVESQELIPDNFDSVSKLAQFVRTKSSRQTQAPEAEHVGLGE